jgi:hypothetical protein
MAPQVRNLLVRGGMIRRLTFAALLPCVAMTLTACGGSSSSSSMLTSATSPTPTLNTENFAGTLDKNGTTVFNFTVTSSGYTLLAGYTSIAPASVAALGLGIGVWDASTSTCGLNVTQSDIAKPGSTALSGTAAAGSFCLRVYDSGGVPDGTSANFTLQVQHY